MRRRGSGSAAEWTKLVDPHLLKHLTIGGAQTKQPRPIPAVAGAMILATIIGLAGLTWQEQAVPRFEGGTARCVRPKPCTDYECQRLDPVSLTRSVHKLRDILARTEGDEHGLVIYSDTPFVAAPLTSDPKIIEKCCLSLATASIPRSPRPTTC